MFSFVFLRAYLRVLRGLMRIKVNHKGRKGHHKGTRRKNYIIFYLSYIKNILLSEKNNWFKMRILYFFFLFLILTISCKRNQLCDFPYVSVNVTLGIVSDLGNLGPDQVYFLNNHGFNNQGIVIYRSFMNDDYGNPRYYAFDRTCPYEPDYSCKVDTAGNFGGLVECKCCKSQYLLMYEGSVFKGPAVCPLRQYSCIVDGDRLIIRN